ncbi:hypothetical protein AVEN_178417-1 [Araneus ventricosus]|uniref:Tc1-like transposase DDE domain-containing protein n=1 Tax=Araneus ventricosus TaxID=182803 RepID=A0A4Y2BCI4_ARAVE|nr:hypothetical protein AVEN_178417-1 [Araneus ventricosus]
MQIISLEQREENRLLRWENVFTIKDCRVLIWGEHDNRYHKTSIVERHSYKGGGIMVSNGISLGGYTHLHELYGGTLTAMRYRDKIVYPYVRPYVGAIGDEFFLMEDNAGPHRSRFA